MELSEALTDAAARIATVVRGVSPRRLDAATPCPEYSVRRLINHLLYWSPIIEEVGLRKTSSPDRRDDGTPDRTVGDWQGEYLGWLDRIVEAWAPAAAWAGTATVSGRQVPAATIGEKSLVELVVHGWDLARGTGQEYRCPDALAHVVKRVISDTAEETRALGMFGPAVRVEGTAAALDQALAFSGRDPGWRAEPAPV
ncbi:TIGR03086 family metal-binding protein [Amycolatopsis pithecellobii]|uniref:TIGR03086 family protein n=1 Tax=Amycolatopsis pithecellobii TaxID=664692 RepID=A0A6N7ZAZ1_9PSEU|nr:TIGR03086 family metal-binding protein [Amycolatopsis pithecellobii]MTD58845.1 TIGR03086 family protein [Amycolatopsis pithecellobii]